MTMALTQAPRTGALAPMGVGAARLFLKNFLKPCCAARAFAGYCTGTGLPTNPMGRPRAGASKKDGYL